MRVVAFLAVMVICAGGSEQTCASQELEVDAGRSCAFRSSATSADALSMVQSQIHARRFDDRDHGVVKRTGGKSENEDAEKNELKSDCAAFCQVHPLEWTDKCKWNACSACDECGSAAEEPTEGALDPSEYKFFGCFPDGTSGVSKKFGTPVEATKEGIEGCFSKCQPYMYAGLGCSSSEGVKCYCQIMQTGVSPIIPMSAPGNCYEDAADPLGDACNVPVEGYEVGGANAVAFYGVLPAKNYVVDAEYTPVAVLPSQPTGDDAWPSLKDDCLAPSGESLSALLGGGASASSNVTIPAGTTYLLDHSATIEGTLIVEEGATLAFAEVAGLTLAVQSLEVYGTLQLGTEGCPLKASGVTITLMGPKPSERGMEKGIIVNAGGVLDMHGTPYTPTWSKLDGTAEVGSSTVKLQDAVNWVAGQQVVVVTTRHGDMDEVDHQNEVRTIQAVSGSEVTLDSPLEHTHFGGEEYQGEVGLLSRSITVQGDEQSEDEKFGGHTICKKEAICRLSYVLGYRMGQKNCMGRYPFHFHRMGDVQQTSYLRGLAVNRSYFRAYTIHGTSNTTLSSSVAYHVTGTAVYMEDGIEEDNLIEFNLIAHVLVIKPLDRPHRDYNTLDDSAAETQWVVSEPDRIQPTDLTPACFYILNQKNRFVGNVASGGFSGFFFPATPFVLGLSREDAPEGYQPVLQNYSEFDGNTVHSSGQYWLNGGCIYVGGILLSPDESNHSHYEYNFAKFPKQSKTNGFKEDIYRGRMHMTNTKFWACSNGLLAWGAKLTSRPLLTVDGAEWHDCRMGIQFFAHNWLANAVFTAQTANVDAWRAYKPATAFKTYDMAMQTLFANVTLRGYKGPGDVGFLSLITNGFSAQEGFVGLAGIKALDTGSAHLVNAQRGGYCDDAKAGVAEVGSGTASQFGNMQDLDGSLTEFEGGGIMGAADCPEYDDTNYRTKNWWKLDDEGCKVLYADHAQNIVSGDEGTVGAGFMSCPMTSSRAWASHPRTVVEVVMDPRARGVVYQWGHEDRRAELIVEYNHKGEVNAGTAYGIMGTCCDIGWYLQLDEGNPTELTLRTPQMVSEGGLLFATRYPAGAGLGVQRCTGRDGDKDWPLVCDDLEDVAEKQALLDDSTGAKYFVDGDGILFLRLVDPKNQWFEHGAVKILQNMRDYAPHYVVKTDKTGHTDMKLPAEDWMASA